MARPITIITGQFGDVVSDELFPKMQEIGYDGLELACGTDHFDVRKCLDEPFMVSGRETRRTVGAFRLSTHV